MLRAIILSLILFVAFGTIVPLVSEYSEASVQTRQRKHDKKKLAQKYRRMALRKKSKKQRTFQSSKRTAASAKRQTKTYKRKNPVSRKYSAKRVVSKKKRTHAAVVKRKVRTKRKVVRKRSSARKYVAKRSKKRPVRRVRTTAKKYTSKRKRSVRKKAVARKRTVARKAVKRKSTRKYTRKWWANYRAKQRRNKAIASRKRSMKIRAIRLAQKKRYDNTPASVRYQRIERIESMQSAPQIRMQSSPQTQLQQDLITSGDVLVEVFGAAVGETVTKGRNTMVGGVSTTMLRRTVIDQMIRESGWVENDYQKEVDGKKVYVVVAKAPDKNNNVRAKTYYFTESNGKIYKVAATSKQNTPETANKESEDAIRRLEGAAAPPQQAKKN